MKHRINKNNRPLIEKYVVKQINSISRKKKNTLTITDLWDVQFAIEKKFNISDYASQNLTWGILATQNTSIPGEWVKS